MSSQKEAEKIANLHSEHLKELELLYSEHPAIGNCEECRSELSELAKIVNSQ